MARSDDKSERKRPSRPRTESTGKKDGPAKKAGPGTPKAAPKKKAAAPASRKSAPAAPARPGARRTASPARAKAATPPKPAAPPRAAAPRKRAPAKKVAGRPQPTPPGLDEEERIEDAKYQPRQLPPRLFEEERFIFPDSYGQSRIRLLVKDPDWLFAHWDVDPQSLADLRAEMGERASALSSLTLRVSDPQHGGESRVLLPDGARSWYIRADTVQRSYRAELGLTLPSGEFRSLAQSNTVTTPRSGPAPGAAPRRVRFDGATPPPATSPSAPAAPSSPRGVDPGPWHPDASTMVQPTHADAADRPVEGRRGGRPGEPSGGASDVYRR